jgi:hypothetical protein
MSARLLLAFLAPGLAALALYEASCDNQSAVPLQNDASLNDAGLDRAPIPPYDGLPPNEAAARIPVHAEFMSTPITTDTMQLMFAGGEMQTSGEPFATNFAGRFLPYYLESRWATSPDRYYAIPSAGVGGQDYVIDLFGFSAAVESYEYSKYHVNMISFQSGAGVSLINGPLVLAGAGAAPFDKLQQRMVTLIAATGADITQYALIPPPANNSQNDFGFPGLWPSLTPYRSFDVSMAPSRLAVAICVPPDGGVGVHGYGGVSQYGGQAVPLYECDYNSLRLSDRNQAEHVVGPGIMGYATWKQALWAIDFTGRLHDSQANGVNAVAPQYVTRVATRGNTVQGLGCAPCGAVAASSDAGTCPPGCDPGVFVGSTPLEGIWGLTMVEEMDNAGAWLLSSWATANGSTLTGFSSILDAIDYDYTSPLVWFPTAIAVSETTADGGAAARYPSVGSLTISDSTSRSVDLAALAQGFSLFFAMTDSRNVAVGQQVGLQIAFGGTLFPTDNGLPDGENTAHDRALAVMRVAFIDLDRIHVDPATKVVVDSATVTGGSVARGTTVTTRSLAHVVIGLRHLLMACNAAVSQYGAPDPDPSKDDLGILNAVPIHPPGTQGVSPPSFSARARDLLIAQAQFVRDTLTAPDGSVRNGATLVNGQWSPMADATTLEAQSAALRVLVEAWLLTQDTSYQDRGRAVARALLSAFWSDPARMFRWQASTPDGAAAADDVVMTPERFGWLQQALRETYKTLWIPGDPLLDRTSLEDRITRVNKLYLNGWDDLNGDQLVEKDTGECLAARMQIGEQALTGEVAVISNGNAITSGPDRERDCVINIAYMDAGSVLAGAVHFHAP